MKKTKSNLEQTKKQIEILEQIPDGEGCWKDKISTIQLVET